MAPISTCCCCCCFQALITVHKDTAQALAPGGLQALLPPRIRPFNVGAEMFIRQLQGSNIGEELKHERGSRAH